MKLWKFLCITWSVSSWKYVKRYFGPCSSQTVSNCTLCSTSEQVQRYQREGSTSGICQIRRQQAHCWILSVLQRNSWSYNERIIIEEKRKDFQQEGSISIYIDRSAALAGKVKGFLAKVKRRNLDLKTHTQTKKKIIVLSIGKSLLPKSYHWN